MRRIVAMRSGWVFSTIRFSVSSPWQRAQRSTSKEAAMRSNSPGGILAPGWLCMRSMVRSISDGSIETVAPSRRALWHSTQFLVRIWRTCSGRSEATSRLLARSEGKLATRC